MDAARQMPARKLIGDVPGSAVSGRVDDVDVEEADDSGPSRMYVPHAILQEAAHRRPGSRYQENPSSILLTMTEVA